METLWFCLVAAMLAVYVVLDGFDLGAGIVHLLVARTEPERRLVLRSIGPVWDGNEVWLLTAGGTLYFAFPPLYASSFSGFYLPLMIVLWLLILRGLAIELRDHVDSPAWKPFWDAAFSLSSLCLALFFGAALGGLFASLPSARAAAREARAFLASCGYLAGMLASAAFGLYPDLLPSRTDPAGSLTVHNAAASAYGLRVGLAWWIPGMTLAAVYVAYVYRHFAG